jgi:hypothetical protein
MSEKFLGLDGKNGRDMLHLKLIGQQITLNQTMYLIFSGGFVISFMLFMVAQTQSPAIYYYVPFFAAATMFGVSLCHYLLHEDASYLAKKGYQSIRDYEDHRAGHKYKSFILLMNISLLLLLSGTAYISSYYSENVISALLYTVSVAMFGLSQPMAKAGWNFNEEGKEDIE